LPPGVEVGFALFHGVKSCRIRGLIRGANNDHEPTDCPAVQRFLDWLIPIQLLDTDMSDFRFRALAPRALDGLEARWN